MAEISGFHNSVNGDRRVKADFFARFLGSFIGNGIYPNPSTNLQVIANGDMTVTVKAGKAWVNGVFYENTADKVITLDVADGVLKRIDRIVVSDITLERDTYSKVKKGSFASSPVAPALQRDADAYDLGIADIYIGAGATSITQVNITDLRLNNTYCGIVHGLFDQVDGETLFIQFQAIFDDFMESLEGVLDENAAGNLLNLINDLVSKIGSITSLTTTEKSNLVGAINELVTSIADIESDLSVHTTALSNNAQDIESQAEELGNHKILKASASVLGHVKTDSVDETGNLLFPVPDDLARYKNSTNINDFDLINCIFKNDQIQLGSVYSGVDETVSCLTNSNYMSGYQYFGIVLDPSKTAKRIKGCVLFYSANTVPQYARLRNRTTGECGSWRTHLYHPSEQATPFYEFGANDIQYSSLADIIEIQFMAPHNNASYTHMYATALHNYFSNAVYYTDYSFSSNGGLGSPITPTQYPRVQITLVDSVIPVLEGSAIKNVEPKDLEKWGNVKWKQQVPANTNVRCDLIKEVTAMNKSVTYTSYSTGNAGIFSGLKIKPLKNLSGIKIQAMSGQSAVNKVAILDEDKNMLKEFTLFSGLTVLNSNVYTVLNYDFQANSIYYIVGTFMGTSWSASYATVTFPLANEYFSILGGLFNGTDQTTKCYCFMSVTPIESLSSNVDAPFDLSALDTTIYSKLSLRFLLSRSNLTDTPKLYETSITWRSGRQLYPNAYELIAKTKMSTSAASLSVSNIPTIYKYLKIIIRNVTCVANNSLDLLIRFNDDASSVDYGSNGYYGSGSSNYWSGSTAAGLQIGPMVATQFLQELGSFVELDIEQSNPLAWKRAHIDFLKGNSYQGEGIGVWKNLNDRIKKITLLLSNSSYLIGENLELEIYGGY